MMPGECSEVRGSLVSGGLLDSVYRRGWQALLDDDAREDDELNMVFLCLLSVDGYSVGHRHVSLDGYLIEMRPKLLSYLQDWASRALTDPLTVTAAQLFLIGAHQSLIESHFPELSMSSDRAEVFLKASAERDCSWALNALGCAALHNDLSVALQYFQRCISIEDLAIARLNMGFCYQEGLGCSVDIALAMDCYRRAGACGLTALGTCYELGLADGTPDWALSALCYREAAESLSCLDSMHSLYTLLRKGGAGLAKDLDEALMWLDRAAGLGDERAQKERSKLFDEVECDHALCSCKLML